MWQSIEALLLVSKKRYHTFHHPLLSIKCPSFLFLFPISVSLSGTGSFSRGARLEYLRLRDPHAAPHCLRLELEQSRAKM